LPNISPYDSYGAGQVIKHAQYGILLVVIDLNSILKLRYTY
jgi:hypothetical protein